MSIVLHAVVPAQQGARYARIVTQHLDGVVLEEHLDVGGVEDALLHRLRGAQEGLADDHVDLAAQRSQIGGLLAGRVAAADHRDILLAVEDPSHVAQALTPCPRNFVSEGSPRYLAVAPVEMMRLSPAAPFSPSTSARKGSGREVDLRDRSRTQVGTEAFGLGPHPRHQFRAVDPFRESREVLDLGGRGELPARLDTLVEYRRQVGATDRWRYARRARCR